MDHATFISGIKYPNRVFVGGLPREAVASDLADFFNKFGQVTESKIILNEDGSSKGYGFVTFASSEDVKCVFRQGVIFYKKKKLNLGPAIRKQAPETPGEPIIFVRGAQSSPQPPQPPQPPLPPQQQQFQMAPSPIQMSPPTSHLPPSPTQLTPYYQSMSVVPTYPDVCYRHSYPWYQATA